MKNILKKNQIIIYVIAIMLMTAGYLNYTTNNGENSVQTSLDIEAKDDSKLADIGDATLVSSNDILTGDAEENKLDVNKTNKNNTTNSAQDQTNSTNSIKTNEALEETSSSVNSKSEYFTKSKLERDNMYSQMLETYDKILNSNNALETQKQSATEEIKKINDIKNSIMICENLIRTKGFLDVVIFVNGESVSAIVETKEELKQEEVAQIQNIIERELKTKAENIHISSK